MGTSSKLKPLLSGKTILVTGASRGLGEGIARAMWAEGANLILVARNLNQLELIKESLLETALSQQSIFIYKMDLSQGDFDVFAEILSSHAVIDVLINNAAIQGPIGNSWEIEWDEFYQTLEVDLIAPIKLCRKIVPKMIKQGQGKIINLSGGGATGPRARFSAYAIAKTALVRFSEVLAEELESYSIEVNCIAPGIMGTGMLEAILDAGEEKAGSKEYQIAKQKAGDVSNMQRAVELCIFLASSVSNGISGKLLSAIWDPWVSLADYVDELQGSDIYTLRRIVPADRDKQWN